MANAITAENGRLDWLGVLCSFGCAVHCAAMPLVVATLPSLTSLKWLADPLFHQVVAVLCGFLVVRAILPSYRVHRDSRVLAMASLGVSLLFVAAFVLPDACCSSLQLDAWGKSADKVGLDSVGLDGKAQAVHSKSAFETPKIVLVSSSGSAVGKMSFARGGVDTTESTLAIGTIGPTEQSGSAASGSGESPVCEHEGCEHTSTYGRPLLSAAELASHLGISGAQAIIQTQPFLSPLGGLFLIVAHIMNIRLRFCGRDKCCRTGR